MTIKTNGRLTPSNRPVFTDTIMTIQAKMTIPSQQICMLASLVKTNGIFCACTEQVAEIILSRGFQLFLDTQPLSFHRITTRNNDYIRMLLRVVAEMEKEAIMETLRDTLEYCEEMESTEGVYLQRCRSIQNLNETVEHIQNYIKDNAMESCSVADDFKSVEVVVDFRTSA